VRAPEVGVVVVAPEGRDLVVHPVATDDDGSEPVLVDRVRQESRRLPGERGRREVPARRRRPAGEDVARPAADDVGRVALRPEGLEDRVDRRGDGLGDRRLVDPGGVAQFRPRNR
jgi:hypothetical protein